MSVGRELMKRILGRYGDHGTAHSSCIAIVRKWGKIDQGVITLPDDVPDHVWDAADYLIQEWDYACA